MILVGVQAHAWPSLFKRPLNPNYDGVGSGSRVGRVMVHIDGNRSGSMGWPRLEKFPWMGSAEWRWDPPESGMLVVYPGDHVVKRDWVISWPAYRPKGAILGVFRTGPGRATIVGVHGAWVWGMGLVGAVALLLGPVQRTVRERRRAKRPWSCAQCRYDLTGIAQDKPCPECGFVRTKSVVG